MYYVYYVQCMYNVLCLCKYISNLCWPRQTPPAHHEQRKFLGCKPLERVFLHLQAMTWYQGATPGVAGLVTRLLGWLLGYLVVTRLLGYYDISGVAGLCTLRVVTKIFHNLHYITILKLSISKTAKWHRDTRMKSITDT